MPSKARWRLHWLLLGLVSPPGGMDRNREVQLDIQNNRETVPPGGESVRLECFWGLELYGPGEVQDLQDKLQALKWSAGYRRPVNDNAANWVKVQSSYGSAGSWYNVGIVTRPGEHGLFPLAENKADLPGEVDYLTVSMLQISPSLTCVLIGFMLKDSYANAYSTSLAEYKDTITERSNGWGLTRISPAEQKRRSVEATRSRLQGVVKTWFASNIPGYFSGGSAVKLPTAELVVTTSEHLLRDSIFREGARWKALISDAPHYDVWVSEEHPALRLSGAFDSLNENPSHTIISLCSSLMPDDGFLGEQTARRYQSFCEDEVKWVLAHHGCVIFLQEIAREIKQCRAALRIGLANSHGSSVILQGIQGFFDRMLGTPAVLTELHERCKSPVHFASGCGKFTAIGWSEAQGDRDLETSQYEQTKYLSGQNISAEHGAREHFEQLSSVLSVRESVKAQKRMEFITIVALFVSVASLIAAVPSLKHFVSSWLAAMLEFVREWTV